MHPDSEKVKLSVSKADIQNMLFGIVPSLFFIEANPKIFEYGSLSCGLGGESWRWDKNKIRSMHFDEVLDIYEAIKHSNF